MKVTHELVEVDGKIYSRAEAIAELSKWTKALRLMNSCQGPTKWKVGQKLIRGNHIMRVDGYDSSNEHFQIWMLSTWNNLNQWGASLRTHIPLDALPLYEPWPRVGDWVRCPKCVASWQWLGHNSFCGHATLEPASPPVSEPNAQAPCRLHSFPPHTDKCSNCGLTYEQVCLQDALSEKPSPPSLEGEHWQRAGGVPLTAEEYVRCVLDLKATVEYLLAREKERDANR